ncbi:molybdate ABC transporter substrate-binding protein [Nitrospira moscoviensis]|uniref:Molybdenum ABC transporter, periplasmic binding protein n=1 Tax=Nitrospira moscoviensis TaxID=42253 RepID=A0A0K2GEJ2_NITMO|nr:molybdate ABC transporter substrate-binding protein [Nitrospira moscoviensis]ALA59380.1 Molybdenum ABC transporter, periplasmic binding protein [Nitrospira moscoviensis]
MMDHTTGWRRRSIWCVAACVAALSATAQPARSETLTIGAAHSLKPVLRDVLPIFESRHPSARVRVVYGPSVTLREQIEEGAPLDVFLPASFDQVRHLQARRLTIDGPPRIFARTSVVLIASAEAVPAPVSFRSLKLNKDVTGRIAIANPATDALGVITAELLSNIDIDFLNHLRSRIVYGHHSGIIDLVSSGEADIGIVYRIDAVHAANVRILDEAPRGFHPPVEFGAAVVWTCRPFALPLAREFLDFMLDPAVQRALREHGFQPVSAGTVGTE